VADRLTSLGFMVEANVNDSEQLKKKIRNAELNHFGYIFSVGAKEVEAGLVDVRAAGGKQQGKHSIEDVIKHFTHLTSSRCHPTEDFPGAAPSPAPPASAGAD
jgi:threonyl-tRNA synthetase